MAAISSQTATSCFVLSLALSTLLLVTSCSCSETAVPAAPSNAATQPSKAKPTPDRAPVAPSAETLANDSQQDVDRDAAQRPARVAQRSERERPVEEVEPEQWEDEAEYEEEYDEYKEDKDERDAQRRREKAERQKRRRQARDERRLARGLPLDVRGYELGSQGEEPSRHQLGQADPDQADPYLDGNRPERPFEAALNDDSLNDETMEEVRGLPKDRRRWEVRNRLKLDGLRVQVADAHLAGDALAKQEAQDELDALKATKPTLSGILSGSTNKGPTS